MTIKFRMQKRAYLDYKGDKTIPLCFDVAESTEEEHTNFRIALMSTLNKNAFFKRKLVDGYPVVERFEQEIDGFVEVSDESFLDIMDKSLI